eukprot:m.214092 g.214092  ORF g.214092 m.214092 type:complete len:64 (-) comp13797_c1_seq1:1778-1969(-)
MYVYETKQHNAKSVNKFSPTHLHPHRSFPLLNVLQCEMTTYIRRAIGDVELKKVIGPTRSKRS